MFLPYYDMRGGMFFSAGLGNPQWLKTWPKAMHELPLAMRGGEKPVQLAPNPPKFLSTKDGTWAGFKTSKHRLTNMKAPFQLLLNLNSIDLQGFRFTDNKTWNTSRRFTNSGPSKTQSQPRPPESFSFHCLIWWTLVGCLRTYLLNQSLQKIGLQALIPFEIRLKRFSVSLAIRFGLFLQLLSG